MLARVGVATGPLGTVGMEMPGPTMSSSMAKVYVADGICLRPSPFDPVVRWPAVTVMMSGPAGKSSGTVP